MALDGEGAGAVTAVAEQERQVAALRESLGDQHPDTLAALRELMTVHREAGNLAAALGLAEELLAESRQRLGPQHPETLSMAVAIANWRQHLGDVARAADDLAGLIPLLDGELGRDHPDTLTARHMLASYAGPDTDPALAVTTWFQLFADEQRVFGAENLTTLGARHNLAIWRRQLGDIVGATDEMAQVSSVRARLLGNEHPDTLASWRAWVTWRGDAGDTEGAHAGAATLIPLLGKVFGDDHEQTLGMRHLCLLWAPASPNRDIEVLADWAVLIDEEIRALGIDHPLTVAGQTAFAARRADWEADLDEGEWVDADLYQQMELDQGDGEPTKELAARAKEYATEHRSRIEALLEHVIVMKKEIGERSKAFGDGSESALSARYDLAYALWNGGEYPDAAQCTQHLLEDCARNLGDEHALTASVRQLQAAGQRYTQFPLGGGDSEPPADIAVSVDEPDTVFPNMTVSQVDDIRRYAAEALAEIGMEAALSADGTAFVAPDGAACWLEELVRPCSTRPSDQWRPVITDIMTKFAAFSTSLSTVGTMEWPELSTRVRARVVPGIDVEQAQGALSYAWPLADGLYEVLCLDFPDVISYLTTSQLQTHDIDRLREAARRNTAAEPIEGAEAVEGDGVDVQWLHGASSFVASKILDLQALIPEYIPDASHGVVLGVPNRNHLFLHAVSTSKKMLASINTMSTVCPAFCKEYPGPINGDLYFWKDGVLQRISRQAPDTGQYYVEFSGAIGTTLAELPD
ncbi:Mycobacterium rhizamassiliense ORFan [Mycobacterium rhizamassiliense]|uniref:Mycobacterium rhizamassiliense ORFan n=1 Tax=Mycobacterium rhizamassiliense TaxID=1841860 RepID=A0A2U3NZB2_9MYCO|nr:tetratricopeptide repeat protein [Mycobacterium rhizamassiliense]SPM36832.1 Mycobacterium rhizamassiliense ORFan [Mycobacterium rhizamassiliense]